MKPLRTNTASRTALALFCTLAVVACDSGPGDETDDACARIGRDDLGTVTATTPAGRFDSGCASVVSDAESFLVIVQEPGSGAGGGETIELFVRGVEPGAYEVGEDAGAEAMYGPSPSATVGASSGTVTLTSVDGGFEGTFEFTTVTGGEVTDGRFDLDL